MTETLAEGHCSACLTHLIVVKDQGRVLNCSQGINIHLAKKYGFFSRGQESMFQLHLKNVGCNLAEVCFNEHVHPCYNLGLWPSRCRKGCSCPSSKWWAAALNSGFRTHGTFASPITIVILDWLIAAKSGTLRYWSWGRTALLNPPNVISSCWALNATPKFGLLELVIFLDLPSHWRQKYALQWLNLLQLVLWVWYLLCADSSSELERCWGVGNFSLNVWPRLEISLVVNTA